MSKLYSTGKIAGLEIRNRLVMTPMHLAYCPNGEATDRIVEFYRVRAKGGAGLLIVGGVGIDPVRVNQHCMIQLYNDDFIPGLKKLTDAVHKEGAKIFPQLLHAGRYARSKEYGGMQAVAPSAVKSRFTGETPQELTLMEIGEIISWFAEAAGRAKKAGFDGVEIVGSAGYLIAEFLSPITNLRQDKYGGDLHGRMTFVLEVVSAIRRETGADFPIMVRIAGNEFMKGGNTNSEAKEFCKVLEKAGVDAFNVTGGWHETNIPQLTMDVPPGAYVYLAREIKSVVSVPVMACNRINIQKAEEIIDNDEADFIGIARGFVADPELANKAVRGEYNKIRPCVACNQGCMDNIFFGKTLNCLCNAEAGREAELMKDSRLPTEIRAGHPEKILIIGAGVAGLEYARVAALRGHSVTIWEEKNEAGGQALIASMPPGRQDFRKLVDFLVDACRELKVNIIFNKKAEADDVLKQVNAGVFDRIVVAAGARPMDIPVQIDKDAPVVQAWDVLRNQVVTGRRVVIIGGGAVGVETALFLAEKGTIDAQTLRFLMLHKAESPDELYRLLTHGNKVITVVEALKSIGKDIGPSTRWIMLMELERFNVGTMDNTRAVSIGKEGVTVEGPEGRQLIPADTVILAVGAVSNDGIYTGLKGKVDKLQLIGDACKPEKIQNAITQAYEQAIIN